MGQLFERPTRLRRLATRAIALGRRTDVYVGCAPRTRRHGGRDAVARAFVLWADCDGDDAVAALERFEPAPSIVIASGTGEQLPRLLAADASRSRATSSSARTGGSRTRSAPTRRPRTPRGSCASPAPCRTSTTPPTPVEAIRLDAERRLRAADVVGALPDPPAPPRRADRAGRAVAAMTRCWRSRPTSTCGGCSASRCRAIARCRCPFHDGPAGKPACLRDARSAAGTASGAAAAAARSTTSPPRCTATPRAARTSCACAPSCAACSDSRPPHERAARLARASSTCTPTSPPG